MKKLAMILTVCLLLFGASALADAAKPRLPAGDFAEIDVSLSPGKTWPVYTGPGLLHPQANAGKAKVSTNGWVQVIGVDNGRLMVQYAVSDTRLRIGWIDTDALADGEWQHARLYAHLNALAWHPCHTVTYAALTDDPLLSRDTVIRLQENTPLYYLGRLGDWAYVEHSEGGAPACGFVPCEAIALDPVDVDSHPYFRFAADFLENAGIEAEPRGIEPARYFDANSATIHFDLKNGGTFRAYYFGGDLNEALMKTSFNWTIENCTDEDLGKYLTAALQLLADVENGSMDQAENWYDAAEARRVLVSNGLLYHDYLGEQGVRVLLRQLAAHDDSDALNSLRARLASRLLGVRDKTGVDPALGCAWYDALRLAQQDDLPPVDAAVYEPDPVIRAAENQLIARYAAECNGFYDTPEYDQSKGTFLVSLQVCQRRDADDSVTLWAGHTRVQLALYDGTDIKEISSAAYPLRLTLRKNADGGWQLTDVTEPGDGEDYWPGIVALCDGDEALAERLAETDSGISEAIAQYFSSAGYPDAKIMN